MSMMIDAHMHYADDDPALLALLDELNIKLLNICVAEKTLNLDRSQTEQNGWRGQADLYRTMAQTLPQRYAWCTTFDLPRFDDRDYAQDVIAALEQDFEAGAVACKIWKNIGMQVKNPSGQFFMADDPLLEPVLGYIEKAGRTLLTHIGSGLECWQPLTKENPHYEWYKNNPDWYMYGKPGYPTREQLMRSRDHLLERHPNLRIVGAHLGCLEDDLSQIAARLDRYPNFAVDTSARLVELATQNQDEVRRFLIDYQDRILFGTDVVMRQRPSTMTSAARTQAVQRLRANYETHFAYFASAGPVNVRGHDVEGLGLPDAVLEKIYLTNAQAWYPDI